MSRRRWLMAGVAPVVVAAVVVAIVVTASGQRKSPSVFVEVPAATVRAGARDRVEAVNGARYQVGMTSCGLHQTPRTGTNFRGGKGRDCGDYEPIAPHSHMYLGNPTQTPGKYWIWFGYRRSGSHVVQLAHAKLTVLGPVPKPVVLTLAHTSIGAGSPDAVELTNTGAYAASNTGCSGPGASPRTSVAFPAPHMFCAGGAGPSVPAHSSIRFARWTTPQAPGRYWVSFDYFYGPSGLGSTAYAKLTVLRPDAATTRAPTFQIPSAATCAQFNQAVHMLLPRSTPHPATPSMDYGAYGEKTIAWMIAEHMKPRESVSSYACDWQGKSLSKAVPDIQATLTVMHLSHPLTRNQARQIFDRTVGFSDRILGARPPHWSRVPGVGSWGMRLDPNEWFAKGDWFVMFAGGGLSTRQELDKAARALASELP